MTTRMRIQLAPRLRGRVPGSLLRALGRRVGRAATRAGARQSLAEGVVLRIVDDAEMAKLHERHLGKKGPTDVLSFPAAEVAGAPAGLGDIVVNWDAVLRQAAGSAPFAWEAEAVNLGVHGLAHLLGHDHATRAQARAMLRLERRAGRVAGLPWLQRPYGR